VRAEVGEINDGEGVIRAEVRDDQGVLSVLAIVYKRQHTCPAKSGKTYPRKGGEGARGRFFRSSEGGAALTLLTCDELLRRYKFFYLHFIKIIFLMDQRPAWESLSGLNIFFFFFRLKNTTPKTPTNRLCLQKFN
jgi:hypothetical protein